MPFAEKFRYEIITAFKAESPLLLKVLGDDVEPFLESKFKYQPVRSMPEHRPDDCKKEAPVSTNDSNNNSEIVYISSDDAPAKHLRDDSDLSDDSFRLDLPSSSSEDEILAPKNGTRLGLLSSDEEV